MDTEREEMKREVWRTRVRATSRARRFSRQPDYLVAMTLLRKLRERLGALRRNREDDPAAEAHAKAKTHAPEMERQAYESSYPPGPTDLPGGP